MLKFLANIRIIDNIICVQYKFRVIKFIDAISSDIHACIIAAIVEFFCEAGGDKAVVLIFEKFAVWAAFARRFNAVAVVNEDFHRVDTRTPEAVTLTQLAAENGTDENTLENPQFIYPKCMEITSGKSSDRVSFDVAPFSVSILKIKLK